MAEQPTITLTLQDILDRGHLIEAAIRQAVEDQLHRRMHQSFEDLLFGEGKCPGSFRRGE